MVPCATVRRWLGRNAPRFGRAGAVAVVTAVCAPILVMVVGFAIDFGYASYINQRLARATDSATVGSVSQTAATTAGGYDKLTKLQAIGVNYFNANVAELGATGVNFSLSVVSDGNQGVIASSTYSWNVPTFFAGILGFNSIAVSGSARTTAHPLVYVNYYILVDASQSMGIASTQADMNALYKIVKDTGNGNSSDYPGCVFGCHVKTTRPDGSLQSDTNENLAHNASPPIQLRIDAAVIAIKNIISQAQAIAGVNKNIKFALYTIQKDPASSTTLHPIATLSTDYAALIAAASTIELGANNANGRGDSDFPTEISEFNSKPLLTVLEDGSGTSATSPFNYFFIITDGLVDTYSSTCVSTHCTSAMNPQNCTPLKSKGTVGAIYTTYSPIWDSNNPAAGKLDFNYKNLVDQFQTQIKPALLNCVTSSDYFFEANDGPDIIAKMQSLFQKTQSSSARFTQ